MSSKEKIEHVMTKNMYLTPLILDEIINKMIQTKSYTLMTLSQSNIENMLSTISTKEEEMKMLRHYFNTRFHHIRDDVYRLLTYPDNYEYDFEGKIVELEGEFIKKIKADMSGGRYISSFDQSKDTSFRSYFGKYATPREAVYSDISVKIPKSSLSRYTKEFQKFVLKQIEKDRNKYCFHINYVLNDTYPDSSPQIIMEDPKKLLNSSQFQELEDKLKNLCKEEIGKPIFYYVERYVSKYLSEHLSFQYKHATSIQVALPGLDKYDDKIKYPTKTIKQKPEEFIGSIYDNVISKIPDGVHVKNVEVVLRQDLIHRFNKFRQLLQEKYPTKKQNTEISIGFHGTRRDRLDSIIQNGLIVPCQENGLDTYTCGARYGNGIYISPDARFSMNYCRGDGCLLVCAILPGKKYVCRENRWGGAVEKGYDSHISEDKTELVLFCEAQVLPCVVVHFQANSSFQSWWNHYNDGDGKPLTHRQKMERMNPTEKREYLKRYAESYLPYGFGKGNRWEVTDVVFSDDEEEPEDVKWYGDINNQHYNQFQESRDE